MRRAKRCCQDTCLLNEALSCRARRPVARLHLAAGWLADCNRASNTLCQTSARVRALNARWICVFIGGWVVVVVDGALGVGWKAHTVKSSCDTVWQSRRYVLLLLFSVCACVCVCVALGQFLRRIKVLAVSLQARRGNDALKKTAKCQRNPAETGSGGAVEPLAWDVRLLVESRL